MENETSTQESAATLFVVDDDGAVVSAIQGVARLLGVRMDAYRSADEFLTSYDPERPGCLLLDYKLPGMSGLELLQKLRTFDDSLPVVMISGHANVKTAVRAMQAGAITLLEKPVELDELCYAIQSAMAVDRMRRQKAVEQQEAKNLVDSLTAKERQVFDFVVEGKTNKEIAKTLAVSVRAVEDRRARMMTKLGADYLSDLIEMHAKMRSRD